MDLICKIGQLPKGVVIKKPLRSLSRSAWLFEKLGMRAKAVCGEMIASLEGGAVSNDDPLAQVLAQARDASQRGDVQSAIQYQEQAVSLARGAGEGVRFGWR